MPPGVSLESWARNWKNASNGGANGLACVVGISCALTRRRIPAVARSAAGCRPSSCGSAYYLEARLDEDVPLTRLAEEAGLSELHFSRLFKKTTGFSPSQYFIRLRMAHARRLLRETTKSMRRADRGPPSGTWKRCEST